MLKRTPVTKDGQTLDRTHESRTISKPFKPPTRAVTDTIQSLRKRKRVSHKGQDVEDEDESDSGKKKKKGKPVNMDKDGVWHNEAELLAAIPKYPVYQPKPFGQVGSRRFSLPTMTNKDGQAVLLVPSNAALGVRPPVRIIPRPLHDPMEDHAIVLFDPTIDDRETDEERKEREKEEAKQKALEEAAAKTAGMYNPHKSLKAMLGEGKDKTKLDKVPVVIDPVLSKVLRPHQIEGVKVCFSPFAQFQLWSHASSFCINARPGWWWTTSMGVSWLTRWVLAKPFSVSHCFGLS